MRVGDLVRPSGRLAEQLSQVNPDALSSAAIVVKGPYEGSHTRTNHSGLPVATEIRMMIDVMISGRIIEGCPASDFTRVTRREVGG